MSLANYEAPILLIGGQPYLRLPARRLDLHVRSANRRTTLGACIRAYVRTWTKRRDLSGKGRKIPGGCRARSELWLLMAVNDGTVYFADPATGRVTALSADDGLERWSIFSPDRVPDKTIVARLIAVDGAVAVGLIDPEANPSGPERLTVWAAADGAELWSEDVASAGIASDGNSLFMGGYGSDGSCCQLSVVDARTGEVDQDDPDSRGDT